MGYGGTATVSGQMDVDLVQVDVDAIVNGIAGAPGSEATLGELATEVTLASLEAEFEDYALDDALDSPLYGDDTVARVAMADLLADLISGQEENTLNSPLHGEGKIWDSVGWETDPLAQFSVGEMIANTFTQTAPGAGNNILGFEGPLFAHGGCCGARSVAQLLDELVYNVSGWGSPLYYDWNSVTYYIDAINDNIALIQTDIAAMKAQVAKLTFDGSNHLEVHTNA